MNILEKAIQVEGSINALAKRLGIVQNAVSMWRIRGVPKPWAMLLEDRYGALPVLRNTTQDKAAA